MLAVRNIGVAFGGLQVLDDVSFDLHGGEIVGFIGPNGAGKTTLFDAISGFVPFVGRVWLDDVEVTTLKPAQRSDAGIGRSFQDARLFPALTVLDTLRVAHEFALRRVGLLGTALGLRAARAEESNATARSVELIEVLGLVAYRDKLVRELSTGTRRIVDLACLLARRPKVILLDEPSSGIAQREAEALGPMIRSIRDSIGCSILLIEHDMPLMLSVADRLHALETGCTIATGAPAAVIGHPEVVRSYLGDDPAAIERSGKRK
ncbi:MAG TPA: ABC transporter ATP-binding protein [Acidimicrobiales bacterium]|nr:ABC transporter ATP-binding protein [Acidimicrobiales bacterium]